MEKYGWEVHAIHILHIYLDMSRSMTILEVIRPHDEFAFDIPFFIYISMTTHVCSGYYSVFTVLVLRLPQKWSVIAYVMFGVVDVPVNTLSALGWFRSALRF